MPLKNKAVLLTRKKSFLKHKTNLLYVLALAAESLPFPTSSSRKYGEAAKQFLKQFILSCGKIAHNPVSTEYRSEDGNHRSCLGCCSAECCKAAVCSTFIQTLHNTTQVVDSQNHLLWIFPVFLKKFLHIVYIPQLQQSTSQWAV